MAVDGDSYFDEGFEVKNLTNIPKYKKTAA
jgi:hypothetical protein